MNERNRGILELRDVVSSADRIDIFYSVDSVPLSCNMCCLEQKSSFLNQVHSSAQKSYHAGQHKKNF